MRRSKTEMLSKILTALTVVRHAVAITLVTGAATAMVAGSLDVTSSTNTTNVTASSTTTVATGSKNTTNGDLEAAIKACLATKDPRSLECHTALDLSGMSNEEFWAKLAFSLSDQVARQGTQTTATPKPEPTKKPETTENTHPFVTGDLLYVVAACVESHERSSAACQKALEMSGLTADEFYAKVAARFAKPTEPATKPTEPTAKPSERTSTEALSILIKDCLTKYETAKNTSDGGTAASEACKRAIEASGLSANDFWARFGPKTTSTKPETTKRPETTPKPTTRPDTTQTVTTAQLEALVKDCFAKYLVAKETHEGGTAALEACNRAISASGLTGDAFWKKFGLPGATSN